LKKKGGAKNMSDISKKYMDADPRKLADWQIAEIAEEKMPTIDQAREMLGLKQEEIIPMEGCVT
jgi:hypothetical protein